MRAISRADLVSSPSEATLAVSVVRSLNSSAPRLTDFDVGACSSMVRVAIKYPTFLLTPFYSFDLRKALRKVCPKRYSQGFAIGAKCKDSGWWAVPRSLGRRVFPRDEEGISWRCEAEVGASAL